MEDGGNGPGAETATPRRWNWLGDLPILAMGGIVAGVFTLRDLVSGRFIEEPVPFGCLLVTMLLGVVGVRYHDHRLLPFVTLAMALAALHAIVPMVGEIDGSSVVAALTVLVLWAGLLVRPELNLLLALYAFVALVVFGAELVPSIRHLDGPGTVAIPTTVTYLGIAWGLGAVLHLRDRRVRRQVGDSVERLERQREDLSQALEHKAAELERSREQLMQAQTLKTVGTMASGLAHELNNILTPIRGLAELTAEGATPEQSMRYGQRILDSAIAASQITSALLTYTRQGTFQPVRSNARQLLQGHILPVLSKSLPANIHLRVDFARNVSIDVDRLLFQQCIANLIFNAVDAMPDGGEIFIGLSTSSEPAGADALAGVTRDDADRSAVITVADTGHGIDAEHIQHIFDPFYTTKAVGSGTGLGLAMVQGTVERHGGRVGVESTPGEGTVFTIFLPLSVHESNVQWPVLRTNHRGPVVLVVTEDEDSLDEFEELLQSTECAPICTADARAAHTLLTEMGDRVDILVLDLELQAVDAARMFRVVREILPELPIVVLSNMPTAPAIQRLIGVGPTRSIRKPLDPSLFATLLTDLLQPDAGTVRDLRPAPLREFG